MKRTPWVSFFYCNGIISWFSFDLFRLKSFTALFIYLRTIHFVLADISTCASLIASGFNYGKLLDFDDLENETAKPVLIGSVPLNQAPDNLYSNMPRQNSTGNRWVTKQRVGNFRKRALVSLKKF